MAFVWFNGNITAYETLAANAFDRAWRFGDGGFETFFFNGTETPLFEHHLRRAQTHAQQIGVEVKFPPKDEMESILVQLSHKNNIVNTSRCRMTWFRNAGGFYLPQNDEGSIFIEIAPFDANSVKREQSAVLYNDQPLIPGKLSPYKKIGSHVYTDAARFAKLLDADEAILLNVEGRVSEATSSNIIARKGNDFFAPPVQDGGIEGVMLYYLSKKLPELGYTFSRRSFTPDELLHVDEILTVNSLRGICCIISLFGKKFQSHSLDLNKHLPLGSKSEH